MKLPKFKRTVDFDDEVIALLCGAGVVVSALQQEVESILWIVCILLSRLQINDLRKDCIGLMTTLFMEGAKIEVEQPIYNKREADSACFDTWNERWGKVE